MVLIIGIVLGGTTIPSKDCSHKGRHPNVYGLKESSPCSCCAFAPHVLHELVAPT